MIIMRLTTKKLLFVTMAEITMNWLTIFALFPYYVGSGLKR